MVPAVCSLLGSANWWPRRPPQGVRDEFEFMWESDEDDFFDDDGPGGGGGGGGLAGKRETDPLVAANDGYGSIQP